MTSYGLTTTGFVPKTFEIIRGELVAALQAAFGLSIDLGDRSIFGQIVAIFAEPLALIWELMEQVYSSQDPDKAAGAALDALCLLTGTFRPAATASRTMLTLTGVPTTLVTTGNKASTLSTAKQFVTSADGTITVLTAWNGSLTYYNVGDRRTNSGNCYICIGAGSGAGSGGPTGTGSSIVDNFATWRYMGQGTGAIDVAAASVNLGAITAVSGDITHIDTGVSGWQGVINLADAIAGQNVATDEQLRVLREAELSTEGTSTSNAIEAALLQIANVTAATVFENDTDIVNSDGMPPHSVECLVIGGADQDIRDALLSEVAAGIATTGTTTGTSLDSQGTAHTIKFSRPQAVNIYVTISLTRDSLYPVDGNTQVISAITAFGAIQSTGKDAVASSIGAQAFKVAGVLDVPPPKIGTAPSPTLNTTIPITSRQLAVFDSSRITVITSLGTP